MGLLRIVTAVLGLALLAFAGTALFSSAAADGVSCGSVVSPRLANIEESIRFAHFVAGAIGEPPQRLAAAGERALHDCRNTLADRRYTTIGTGAGGVALLIGPPAVTWLRSRRRSDTTA
ncbi:MAG TPA: hypothetical protein VF288_06655 [Mycobacteriales bacterium]